MTRITFTNSTKAQVLAAVNAVMGLLITFNVVLTQAQIGAVDVAVNAVMALLVTLTYPRSKSSTPAKSP